MQSGEKQGKVTKLSKNEVLMLNIGSMCTGARVLAVRCCARRAALGGHCQGSEMQDMGIAGMQVM